MARVVSNPRSRPTSSNAAESKAARKGAVKTRVPLFDRQRGIAAVVAILGLALLTAWWARKDDFKTKENAGLGPEVMAGQGPVLRRLIELMQDVEAVDNTSKPEERLALGARVEEELQRIETQIDPRTPSGKQQTGIVALVRSALHAERTGTGEDFEGNWNDENVLAKHGLVTYASKSYWEEAYAGQKYGEVHEWYGGWAEVDANNQTLASMLRPLLPLSSRILMLGCGNSNMSVAMYKEGYRSTVNVDWSDAVIQGMRSLYGDMDGLEWRAMDASAMDFADGSFDAVIEKGLIDALFAGTGQQVIPVLREVHRVLRPGGRFLVISHTKNRAVELRTKAAAADEEGTSQMASGFQCNPRGSLKFDAAAGTTRNANVVACDWSA